MMMQGLDITPLLRGLVWTVALTGGAFAIGAVLGLPLLIARQSRFWPLRVLAMSTIQIVRAIPPLLWLFIIFFGIGMGVMPISPFAAALTGLGFSLNHAHIAAIATVLCGAAYTARRRGRGTARVRAGRVRVWTGSGSGECYLAPFPECRRGSNCP